MGFYLLKLFFGILLFALHNFHSIHLSCGLCRYAIVKIVAQESFQLDLHVDINIDNTWKTTTILNQLLIPIPFCNDGGTSALTGGSIDGFMQLVGSVTDEHINDVLNALGIKVCISFSA